MGGRLWGSNRQQAGFLPCKHKACINPHSFPQAKAWEKHKQTAKCQEGPIYLLLGLEVWRCFCALKITGPVHTASFNAFMHPSVLINCTDLIFLHFFCELTIQHRTKTITQDAMYCMCRDRDEFHIQEILMSHRCEVTVQTRVALPQISRVLYQI